MAYWVGQILTVLHDTTTPNNVLVYCRKGHNRSRLVCVRVCVCTRKVLAHGPANFVFDTELH